MNRRIINIDRVEVGRTPRIVGTISTLAGLRSFDPQKTACDLLEVRLDRVGVDVLDWPSHCRAISLPVVLTIRLADEGGGWTRAEAQRRGLFLQALNDLSAIDVELQSALLPELADAARTRGRAIIVSFHDFDRTPGRAELGGLVSNAAKFASIVKIATTIRSEDDVEVLKSLLAEDFNTPLCVIGMGTLGTSTRTLLPKLGSCLAYGYVDVPAAPGQLSAMEMKRLLS